MSGTDKNTQPQNLSKDKPDSKNDVENTTDALKQAEKDIKNDPDLNQNPDPSSDLDEGELARFEGD